MFSDGGDPDLSLENPHTQDGSQKSPMDFQITPLNDQAVSDLSGLSHVQAPMMLPAKGKLFVNFASDNSYFKIFFRWYEIFFSKQ